MSSAQAIKGWACKECGHTQDLPPEEVIRTCSSCGDVWTSDREKKFCPNCGKKSGTIFAEHACPDCEEAGMDQVDLWMCTSCSKLHWSANEAEACCPDEED